MYFKSNLLLVPIIDPEKETLFLTEEGLFFKENDNEVAIECESQFYVVNDQMDILANLTSWSVETAYNYLKANYDERVFQFERIQHYRNPK
ncbi:TPA: hypothetical protein I1694_002316 [Staphylococcus pseudintermedius]|uniref:hypothetical protein n=1 Tax=Staphylococcus pseudintermedius TaxID=283734 RepID=UPI000C1C7A7C|nr:hypothetical protein [Staphylococcus pseudintermedius]EGQ0390039.1 hypothetical protein [Staphylococcus pseudintermedius]EGQ1286063.1 hypothetical protein [Staphylococcus pseudintermedius]EGQ1635708.1 hypothetical protein [Staphylococcus pseudintermedius]EGQ1676532.1 hypothetical protein [Staphylococcus pseudintermedius]EGQ1688818.1 hypothetical protein [Staphylococcus pseudintermedius]